jgi:diaminohydroxyphosphoribosylaminopyrimidine deaminase / 5-amino-6-(5-phosphoribosylamino)uracil reductase
MTDEHYMRRCLELAIMGLGKVAPNPMVGCVIVHQDKIIGEGYHKAIGEAHAEVNAINSVKDKGLLKDSTLYVNLEPCVHWGRTPPCSDLIMKEGIPKIIIGSVDTFAKVSGLGIRNLINAGCTVKTGICEQECHELNKRFFSYHTKSKPYVILKWAQSKDGFMDIDRPNNEKGIFWITKPETKRLVHKWRSEESGILVGKNTIVNDNPSLTVREVKGNSPTRFIIDPHEKLNFQDFNIGNEPPKTIRLKSVDIANILNEIRNQTEVYISILVEGGKYTLEKFIESGLWDEARIIRGTEVINSGVKAPLIDGREISSYNYGDDHIQILSND